MNAVFPAVNTNEMKTTAVNMRLQDPSGKGVLSYLQEKYVRLDSSPAQKPRKYASTPPGRQCTRALKHEKINMFTPPRQLLSSLSSSGVSIKTERSSSNSNSNSNSSSSSSEDLWGGPKSQSKHNNRNMGRAGKTQDACQPPPQFLTLTITCSFGQLNQVSPTQQPVNCSR